MDDKSSEDKKKPRLKTLNIDGTKYKTNLTKKFEEREPYKANDNKLIRAFIPGTIVKVNIKEGQKVKSGAKLLILEAMKMMNRLTAPMNGVVKKLNVTEGQLVSKNEVLVELE